MRKITKEDLTKLKDKSLEIIKKIGVRNLAAFGSVLLIGGAIYLNFMLFGNSDKNSTDQSGINAGNIVADNGDSTVNSENYTDSEAYFAAVQVNRSRARDEAVEVLQMVIDNDETNSDARAAAMDEIQKIAAEIEAEANIETLVKSKGFEECVAVISGNECSVIVSESNLLQSELAQIQEIVYTQSGILPGNLKIIEKDN